MPPLSILDRWILLGTLENVGLAQSERRFGRTLKRLLLGKSRDPRDVAVFRDLSLVAFFAFHIVINVGMQVGLLPVTGIPLPLLSYGGSSVLCSLIAIGMLQNVYMYRKAY